MGPYKAGLAGVLQWFYNVLQFACILHFYVLQHIFYLGFRDFLGHGAFEFLLASSI